jgi:hypothetical protein
VLKVRTVSSSRCSEQTIRVHNVRKMHHLEIAPDDEDELVALRNGQPTSGCSTSTNRNGVHPHDLPNHVLASVYGNVKPASCQRFGVSRGGIPHRDGNYVFHSRKYRVSAGPSGATTTSKRTKFHSSGFGGINNIAQPGGAKAHAAGLGLANDPDLFIPTSNLGREVPVDCP